MSYNTKKQTTPSKEFAKKCIIAVSDAIAQEWGYLFLTADADRQKWYRLLKYDSDVEQFAIKTVAHTILTQTDDSFNHQNAHFIESVLLHVAKSLARYTIRNPIYNMAAIVDMPEDTDAEKELKKTMKKDAYALAETNVFNTLRNETVYLKKLNEKHKAHKAEEIKKKKMGTAKYNKMKEHQMRASQAAVEHKIQKGVRGEFKESNELRYGKRK